jgi:phage terminase large subunit
MATIYNNLSTYVKVKNRRLIIDFDEIHRLFANLISKPKHTILIEYECEKSLQSKKTLWLKIIERMGLKERFKIIDNEFIYIDNGSAIVFKAKQELLRHQRITHSWIEKAYVKTQDFKIT